MKNFDIKFSFTDDLTEPVSGFDFGNVLITGNKGTFNTNSEDAPFMVLPAIISLLDGMREFFNKRSVSNFNWKTIHETEILSFNRTSKKRILVIRKNLVIAELKENELINNVFDSVLPFVTKTIMKLQPRDSVILDLKKSMSDFQQFLKTFS